MRRPVSILLVVAVLALLGSTAVLYSKYRQTSTDLAETRLAEESSRTRYAQTIDAISEIQDSLNAITVGDANVKMVAGGLQSEKDLNSPNGRDALDRIASLRASIQRNKERIRQLESSLNASGIQVKGLRRMMAGLKESITAKETEIAALSTRVTELSTQVTGLETTVQENQVQIAEKDITLEAKRKEIATVYVVVGNKKDLTQQGVVVAKGGVLGMGKTLTATSSPTAVASATPVDTDAQTVIPIAAEKAQVVSAQAPTSYALVPVEGKMELRILDPAEFRKVKQLVIVTA